MFPVPSQKQPALQQRWNTIGYSDGKANDFLPPVALVENVSAGLRAEGSEHFSRGLGDRGTPTRSHLLGGQWSREVRFSTPSSCRLLGFIQA